MCVALLRGPRAVVRAIRLAAERTPPHRDRHLDLLRAVAILAVVLGHWLAVVVTYHGGFGGDTVLAAVPWTRPLTWAFQVMPVFFLVGGFVNAASLDSYRRRGGTATGWFLGRTDRLIRPTTVFLLTLSAVALLAVLLGAGEGTVATGVWLAVMPLWFLVAYLMVVLLTPVMLALHRRAGLAVPIVLAALVGLGDAVRLRSGPPLLGQAGFVFAWLAIHQLGIAWREGALPARRTVALPMAAGGLAVLVLLTTVGPYPVSMVAVPGERLQNTSPPTLALLALATAQTGLALLLHGPADRRLRRARPWAVVVGVNSVIMTVFLWHLTAVVVAAVALYPTGLMPQPPAGSASWLLLRLPWIACLLVVLAVLVAVFGRVERRAGPVPGADGPASGVPRAVAAVAGAALAAGGLLGAAVTLPTRLPVPMLLAYLAGAGLLRFLRRRPGS